MNTADTVHGISGSVIVTESSSERDRFTAASSRSSYAPWNNPPITSAVTPPWLVSAIVVAPAAIVAAISPNTELTAASIRSISSSSEPDALIAPASRNAAITTIRVFAIPYRPPRSTSPPKSAPSTSGSTPTDSIISSLKPPTAARIASSIPKPWSQMPRTIATSDEIAIARAGGTRRTMLTTTIAGGMSTRGLRTNAASRSARRARAPSADPPAAIGVRRDASVYNTRQRKNEGTAVYIM